jgi:mRNA interferase MazF
VSSPYQPARGDLIWLDFTPQAGTEQAGRRPALVISHLEFNVATGLAAVCPITNTVTGSRFEIAVPAVMKLTGVILSHQMRMLDWIARRASFHARADDELIWTVVSRIEAIIGDG